MERGEVEIWAVTAWVLWNARNKYYFEKVLLQPKVIVDGALNLLSEYQRLMEAQNRD